MTNPIPKPVTTPVSDAHLTSSSTIANMPSDLMKDKGHVPPVGNEQAISTNVDDRIVKQGAIVNPSIKDSDKPVIAHAFDRPGILGDKDRGDRLDNLDKDFHASAKRLEELKAGRDAGDIPLTDEYYAAVQHHQKVYHNLRDERNTGYADYKKPGIPGDHPKQFKTVDVFLNDKNPSKKMYKTSAEYLADKHKK